MPNEGIYGRTAIILFYLSCVKWYAVNESMRGRAAYVSERNFRF